MQIVWTRCKTYEDAKNYRGIIYLHEWNDRPFYWGKAHRSCFGGNRRKISGSVANGRYSSGYRHWIEGCLLHGAKLYIGQLCAQALASIDEIEQHLIHTYGHVANRNISLVVPELRISHRGEVPASIVGGP